jgi:hypothetical protein
MRKKRQACRQADEKGYTHTRTHTQREKEREGERGERQREIEINICTDNIKVEDTFTIICYKEKETCTQTGR